MFKLQAESFHNEDLKLHLLRLEQIENKSFNNGRAEAILPTYVLYWLTDWLSADAVTDISNYLLYLFLFWNPLTEEHNLTTLTQ